MPRRIRHENDRSGRRPDRHPGRHKAGRRGRSGGRAIPLPASGEDMGVAVDSGFLPAASPEGRVLGIDFGKRRIGMAVSDPTGRIAQGLDTIETPGLTHTIEAVEAIAGRYAVRQIVIGLPVNMDGTEGEMARQVIQFAGLLRARLACEVRTWDERLTSSAAQRALADMGYALKGNKHQVDRIAATMLLQNYLDHVRHTRLTSESGPAEEACPD